MHHIQGGELFTIIILYVIAVLPFVVASLIAWDCTSPSGKWSVNMAAAMIAVTGAAVSGGFLYAIHQLLQLFWVGAPG